MGKHASQTSSWESCLVTNVGSFWCLEKNKTRTEPKACVVLMLEELCTLI